MQLGELRELLNEAAARGVPSLTTTVAVAGPGGLYDIILVTEPTPDTAGAIALGLRRGEQAILFEVQKRERPRR